MAVIGVIAIIVGLVVMYMGVKQLAAHMEEKK
jgi:hypothetical protein